MAKNKKPTPVIAKPKENVAYQGDVTLKLMNKNKLVKKYTIKNSCTSLLLQSIALFLTRSVNTNLLPAYMGIGTNNSKDWTIETLNLLSESEGKRVPIVIHSVEDWNENGTLVGYKIPYSATFPYSLIGGTTYYELGLFTQKTGADTLNARIIIPNPGITVTEGMSLIVEWKIGIRNKESN